MAYLPSKFFFSKFAISSKIALNHVRMQMRCRIYGPGWETSSPHRHHPISTRSGSIYKNTASAQLKCGLNPFAPQNKYIEGWIHLNCTALKCLTVSDKSQSDKIRSLCKKFGGHHQVLEAHFSHLSMWSMVKSISVHCFMKNLSTSNNSSRQAHWTSKKKGDFLHSIIRSLRSPSHWLIFQTWCLISHISIFSLLHCLFLCIALSSQSLGEYICSKNCLPFLIAS